MTDWGKILLGLGGAGALYGFYNNWSGFPPKTGGPKSLFNIEDPEGPEGVEEPVNWERIVEDTIDEEGNVIESRITEASPRGGVRPAPRFGRPLNFPENVPLDAMREIPDPVQYFRPTSDFTPNPHTYSPEEYWDGGTRQLAETSGVDYPASLAEYRRMQSLAGAIPSSPHNPNRYRMARPMPTLGQSADVDPRSYIMGSGGLLDELGTERYR